MDGGKVYSKPSIQNDEEYYARVEEILLHVKSLNPSVSVTGGEPTHSPRLRRVCELLKKHNIRKRTITTNGTGLLNVYEDGKTVLDVLIENGFKHLNISKAHYLTSKNQHLMRYGNRVELPDEDLAFIVRKANSNGLRVRLSCVLTKSGVGNVTEMKRYMEYAQGLGVDNVVFRELMRYNSEEIVKGRIYNFCEANRVNLTDVWNEIDKDGDFRIINQVLGYYYYVEVYKYQGVDMVSESADLKQIAVEKGKPSDTPIVYEMVIHPNGCLNGSWREEEDILLNYER